MKLDATDLRYVTSNEFRVLTAVRSLYYIRSNPDNVAIGRNGFEKSSSRSHSSHRPYIWPTEWRSEQIDRFTRKAKLGGQSAELQVYVYLNQYDYLICHDRR